MTDPGERHHLLIIQRAVATTDDHGGETNTWHEHARAWARLRYGTGAERREAAQDRAAQVCTFECDWTPTLRDVAMTDRILLFGAAWDIQNKAIIGQNREVHFTAVANMDEAPDS